MINVRAKGVEAMCEGAIFLGERSRGQGVFV